MKTLLLVSIAIITNLLWCSFTFAFPETGSIYGTVVNEANVPIPFCTVLLMKNTHVSSGTITDSNGEFSISKVKSGKYSLKISSIGFNSEYISDIQIGEIDIRLPSIKLTWGVRVSSVVCSAYRPYCSKPCGLGCICECCMPSMEFDDSELENHSGSTITVDTTSFLALESWPTYK
jgi:hypothetical protein